ncbi:NUDIX hydrolase [Albibacterium sp.]|uniref:NUDIX hydrolase n=1 Tax=Albibacterium sp. TaxID=2952885 RepID=UPI002BD02DCC|nr:NUDIX hydrolase [Albibacterium sp.]HUH20135.1 NUDIX hydrolase [Albibacterium sp.]
MSDLSWKILDSTYLVKAPWAVLRKDVCQMPSGYVVPEYYVLEYPNWVNAVALTADNQFILVRQYRHGSSSTVLEIPGGVIDDGENKLEAVKRELLEETGYSFDSFDEICELFPNPATSNNITTTYLAKGGVKFQNQQLDLQEEIQLVLVSPEELKELLFENKFGQALHSAALFYALRKLGMLS